MKKFKVQTPNANFIFINDICFYMYGSAAFTETVHSK